MWPQNVAHACMCSSVYVYIVRTHFSVGECVGACTSQGTTVTSAIERQSRLNYHNSAQNHRSKLYYRSFGDVKDIRWLEHRELSAREGKANYRTELFKKQL